MSGEPNQNESSNNHIIHADEPIEVRRQILADFCKLMGLRFGTDRAIARAALSEVHASPALPHLSPRMRQTLRLILIGDGEKQISAKLGVSKHTVHAYVKALYKGFEVNTRSELMSKFVGSAEGAAAFQLPPDLQDHAAEIERSAG